MPRQPRPQGWLEMTSLVVSERVLIRTDGDRLELSITLSKQQCLICLIIEAINLLEAAHYSRYINEFEGGVTEIEITMPDLDFGHINQISVYHASGFEQYIIELFTESGTSKTIKARLAA
jgi:hypothetical protein